MRIGLLSDIHANAHALNAVLEQMRGEVDHHIVAGDLVGYGAFPNACVDTIAALDGTVVVGNHDLFVLERLSLRRVPEYGLAAAEWTRRVIRPEVRDYLDQLPQVAERDGVAVAHGSLEDPQEYVLSDERAAIQVRTARERHPQVHTLVLGHTHQQWLWDAGRSMREPDPAPVALGTSARLINPGSVGQSRRRERIPLARAAILDLEEASVTFLAVPYNVEEARSAALRAGLDERAIHAPLPRAPRVRRLIRRVRRRLIP